MKFQLNKVGCFENLDQVVSVRILSEAIKRRCSKEEPWLLKGKFLKENLWLSFIAVPQFEEIQKEPAGSYWCTILSEAIGNRLQCLEGKSKVVNKSVLFGKGKSKKTAGCF